MSDPTENDDATPDEPTAYAIMLDGITQSLRRTKPSAQHIAAGFQNEDLTSVVEIVPLYPESTVAALRARLTILERAQNVMQSDVGDLLRALGLPDHARPVSCHAIMQADIKNGIFELREVREELEAELQRTSDALGEGPYSSISEHAAALRRAHDALRQDAERLRAVRSEVEDFASFFSCAGPDADVGAEAIHRLRCTLPKMLDGKQIRCAFASDSAARLSDTPHDAPSPTEESAS